MNRRKAVIFILALFFAIAVDRETAYAQQTVVDWERIDTAIKKACEWLRSQQEADGSWKQKQDKVKFYREELIPEGLAALCLHALACAGENADSDCMKRGLEHLRKRPLRRTYAVCETIMLLCRLYSLPPFEEELRQQEQKNPGEIDMKVFEPREKRCKERLKNIPAWVVKWLKAAVDWLVKEQRRNAWRYPGDNCTTKEDMRKYAPEDISNTLYALMALHAASRAGISVSKTVFKKAAAFLIVNQELGGPAVPGFPVPAADFDIADLKKLEKDMLKKLKGIAESNQKLHCDEKRSVASPKSRSLSEAAVLKDPYKNLRTKKVKVQARGWAYVFEKYEAATTENERERYAKVRGSMTADAVSGLVICKERIEKGLKGTTRENLDCAIRDGLAWLVKNWTVKKNPCYDRWHMYWLCALERVASLSLCRRVGGYDWYAEGANHLLSTQKPQGNWPEDVGGHNNYSLQGCAEKASTAFAILFLTRPTEPLLNHMPP